MTTVNSFLLLTSCGAKAMHRKLAACPSQSLIENAQSVPCSLRPIGRLAAVENKVNFLR